MKRLITFCGALAFVSFFLPRRQRAARTLWIDAPPSLLFPLIQEPANWRLWVHWNGRILEPEACSEPWSAAHCVKGRTVVESFIPDVRLSYRVESGGRQVVEGAIALEPVGAGTRLTWACWWLEERNPFHRYIDLGLRLWTERNFTRGLQNLKKLAEVRP